MKTCEKCKTQNADSVMFCTTCGTQLKIAADPVQAQPFAPAAPVAPVAPAAPATAFAPTPAAPAKKPLDVKMIGLIAAAVIGLVVGVVGIVMAINSGNKKETPAPVVTPTQGDTDGDTTVATISGNNTGTAVKVGPYTLTIPKEYPFETSENGVLITDPTNTIWAANIMYDDSASYSQVSTNLKKLGEYYTNQGAKNVKTGTAKTGALNYLYVDMLDPEDNIAKTLAIFKADSALFDVVVSDGTINPNHGVVDIVAPIIANAKGSKTSNREIGFGMTTKGVDTLKLDGAFDGFDSSEE